MVNLYSHLKYFNLEGYQVSEFDPEQGMVAHTLKLSKPGKKSYVLKVCSREEDFRREKHFLDFLQGKVPVPRLLGVKGDSALLLEYIEGEALISKCKVSDQVIKDLGQNLAKIHLNRFKLYGDLTQRSSLTKDPKKNFIVKYKEGIDECSGHLSSELLAFCKYYLQRNLIKLEEADGPCLIHRDFRPSNVIANQVRLLGVVDWSSARSSFAEDDFCPLEHGEWNFSKNKRRSFIKLMMEFAQSQIFMNLCLFYDCIGL